MKRVLALIECPDHVCYRYRIAAFAAAVGERGFEIEAAAIRRGILARSAQLLGAGRADVVVLQRKLLAVAHLRLLRRVARRLVYDVDDAVFHRDSFHRNGPQSRKLQRRFQATVAAADAVIAGNDYLANGQPNTHPRAGPRNSHVR